MSLPTHSHAVEPDALSPIDAQYEVSRGSMKLGDATITLKQKKDGCYEYQHKTDPVFMVRMLFGKPVLRSEFCLVDGEIRSRSFRSKRDGVGSGKDNYTLKFDWEEKVAIDDKGRKRKIDTDVYDELSYHIAIRHELIRALEADREPEFRFRMVNRKRIKEYEFAVTGRETIRTPDGKFETYRIQRTNDDKRKTTLWVAPEMDYFPVKVEQQKEDDPVMKLVLVKRNKR